MFGPRAGLSAALVAAMFLLVLALIGCEGDKGPAGPQGEQGDPGTTVCTSCHSDDTDIVAKVTQWENSKHATGGNFERNDAECAGCHTSEGFVERMETGTNGSPINPSPPGCFTCHAPHTRHDFTLRVDDPVTLITGGTFDMGEANLCANCHQAREVNPAVSDTTRITSSYWGPHHGPQSSMLSGNGGHEFAGYNYPDSPHTTYLTDGCIQCHMAAPHGAQAGGHTWKLEYEYHGSETDLVTGCNVDGCHKSHPLEDFDRNDVQTDMLALMDELRTELVDHDLLDEDDEPVADKENTRTEVEAGALFNFLFVLEDKSNGIHNTDYATALLEASLDQLTAGKQYTRNKTQTQR